MLTHYLRGILGYCPNCGKARFTKGFFGTQTVCSYCGLRYANAPGDFVGAAALAYGVVSVPLLLLGIGLVMYSELSLLAIMVIELSLVLLLTVLTHQPIKGLWLAFLVDNQALLPPEDKRDRHD